MQTCKNIACSAGGTRGIMYFGMFSALERHMPEVFGTTFSDYLMNIEGFSGSSVGALASLILILNVPAARIREVCAPQLACVRTIVPRPDISMLLTSYGLDDGQALRAVIRSVLHAGGICEDATFADLYRLLKRVYVCVATNVHTREATYFSVSTTPDTRIMDAVYMSMCVPFVFTPTHHDGDLHVDAALSHNMPRAFDRDTTLFINFHTDKRRTKVETVNDYILAIFGMTGEDNATTPHSDDKCLWLRMPDTLNDEYALDFDMGEQSVLLRMQCGYASTLMHLFPMFMDTIVETIVLVYHVALAHATLTIGEANMNSGT